MGNGMMGIVVYNTAYTDFREYISATLNCKMEPGNTYTVSFWITNGSGPVSPWTVDNIGINFSSSALTQTGYSLINLTPQCLIPTNIATTTWQQYTFTISPTAAWSHITIGNFSPDALNNPTSTFSVPPNAYAYYFIDDIEVLHQPTSGGFLSTSNTTLCSNGSTSTTLHVNSTYTGSPLGYIWQPGNLSGQTVSVTPGVSTVYTVTAIHSPSCIYTATLAVDVATLNLSTNNVTLCSNGSPSTALYVNTTYTASPLSYIWQPGSLSGQTVTVTPGSSMVYTVTAIRNPTCMYTATLAVDVATLTLSTNNVTLCTNASTSTAIQVNTTHTSSALSYVWQPGNLSGQTVNVSPSSPTIYTVTATLNPTCTNTATLSIDMTPNCCSQSTTGLTPLTSLGGTHANTSYFLENTITLSAPTILQDAEILIMPGVEIIVPPGMSLDLDHAHLYACGINMWKGIVVQGNGRITTSAARQESSIIEDAVIAIDIDGTSAADLASIITPIDINRVIFNKNHVGIRISNADPSILDYPLHIRECVFTSRQIPFTSPAPFTSASWPNATGTGTGLRAPFSPVATQGLSPAYLLNGYALSNLKLPYPAQPGHIGIQIDNVGNQPTVLSDPGINIGGLFSTPPDEFNLFDGLGIGIDVHDASLQILNGVFQNMQNYQIGGIPFGGTGINHQISSSMNARLFLGASSVAGITGKSQFWNCWEGVLAKDVYEVNIGHTTFRSDRPGFIGSGPGSTGVRLESNRFNYLITSCEFNNIDNNIEAIATSGHYDLLGTSGFGTYADDITISQNYFGPLVSSTVALSPSAEYSNKSITLDGSSAPASVNAWHMAGNCNIISNKHDRVFRGIRIYRMEDYPVWTGGNEILLEDDLFAYANDEQYGISAEYSKGNLVIDQNIVKGSGITSPWNQRVRLIRSAYNQSSIAAVRSPILSCNQVFDGYVGFEFEGTQSRTEWFGNTMYQKMYIGLSLINNGAIGVQGSISQSSANRWNDNGNSLPDVWSANWQTYVDGTSHAFPGSFLWCEGVPFNAPATNGSDPGGTPFAYTSSLQDTPPGGGTDCLYPNVYPNLPMQRTQSTAPTSLNMIANRENGFEVYPNPFNSNITVKSPEDSEIQQIRISDLSGKVLRSETVMHASATIDLSGLKPAVYFIEIETSNHLVIRKKLIKTP
jgi:hypothetical protein